MSLNKALYVGLAGMNANSVALNVIGDNIANMNTIGYKSGRGIFQEMLGQSLMGSAGPSMVGGGVGLAKVEKMFEQGSLLGTGAEWDLAIGGEGFFAMQGEADGVTGTFFTRAGQFTQNKDGFITNPQGLKLIGYPADVNGDIKSSASPIQIDDSPMAPVATTEVSIGVNLSSTSDVTTFDPANPGAKASSSHQSSVTVYDALGESIEVDIYWSKSATGTWSGNAMVGDVQATPQLDLAFDSSGNLTTVPPEGIIALTKPDGTTLDVKFNFAGSTQYAEKNSATTKLSQNGSQAGTFQNVTVDKDGNVLGTFSNGEEKVLGQVALARFTSDSGLRVMGGGMFASTTQSGAVVLGAPNSNGRGQIMSGALEQSTVDLATEFTNMIIAQRGYQANSRSISTADQLMQELVNLKR